MHSVLVTGGAGFIGSHVCKALQAAGFLPVSFDNLSRGHREAVKWGPLFEGDILDPEALDRAFRRYRPVAVMHFAALAYVGESHFQPLDYYRTNVEGTARLAEAMLRADCRKLVFSSSCATYGHCPDGRVQEGQQQVPINPYGRSKLFAEQVLADADRAHGLQSVVLRYFNAAGSDPDGEIGESHDPETHLIPLALQVASGLLARLDILGDDYPTPDGTCIRDFIHVSDLAAAHLLALERLLDGHGSGQFNLGSGRGFSVREVVDMVRVVTGHAVPIHVAPRRPGDPPMLIADSQRARHVLGWQPQRETLRQQIEDAWRWLSRGMEAEMATAEVA